MWLVSFTYLADHGNSLAYATNSIYVSVCDDNGYGG